MIPKVAKDLNELKTTETMSEETFVVEGISYAKNVMPEIKEHFMEKFESIIQILHCYGVNW